MTRPGWTPTKPVAEWKLRSCVACGRLLDLRRPRCKGCGGTEAARMTLAERDAAGARWVRRWLPLFQER